MRFAVILAMGLAAGAQTEQTPEFLDAEQSERFLAKVEQRMGSIRSVAAEFERETRNKLFKRPMLAHGIILFAQPDHLRWETQKPFQSILIVSGDKVAKFRRSKDGRVPVKLGRSRDVLLIVMDRIRGWFRGSFGDDRAHYDISVAAKPRPMIVLKPKDEALRESLNAIEVDLTEDLKGVERVTIREAKGDSTVMTFRELRRDARFPDDYFDDRDPVKVSVDGISKLAALPKSDPATTKPDRDG